MERMTLADGNRVAEARRRAAALAQQAGFDETDAGRLAITVTEMAGNATRHGSAGELLLRLAEDRDGSFVECICLDKGKGMADPATCMQDGYSTAGGPGTGLGAIRRQSDEIDVFSAPGRGTALLSRVRPRHRDRPPIERPGIGAISLAKPGEEICGDAWSVMQDGGRTFCLVADGLGHGPLAADAAREAVRLFRKPPVVSAADLVERIHHGLRATRGAAVAVAVLDPERRSVSFSGLGNIAGSVTTAGGTRRMVSDNGTAGVRSTRIRAFEYPFAGEPTLVMHSDGLSASWSFDAYPGLPARDPSLIAGVLLRDHDRGRDDVTILVVKGDLVVKGGLPS